MNVRFDLRIDGSALSIMTEREREREREREFAGGRIGPEALTSETRREQNEDGIVRQLDEHCSKFAIELVEPARGSVT